MKTKGKIIIGLAAAAVIATETPTIRSELSEYFSPVTMSNQIEEQEINDYYSLDKVTDARVYKKASNKMNVILMIPDGQSVSEQTLARWYQGYSLGTDKYMCGMVRTYSAESAITDSAAAATAYATGYKTNEGFEGMLPAVSDMPGAVGVTEYNKEMPYATVLEAAKKNGKSTGIVVTAPLMHATPAGFTSHVNSRTLYTKIAKQQIYAGIDVMLGGGRYYLKDGRSDGRNLIDDAEKLGYTYVSDANGLSEVTSGNVFGVFASNDMSYDFDRAERQPSLEEMTVKAIELLNKNENGFFLLVEGSKIDYASHAHDPVGVISESIAFDKAFRAAVRFAESDGNTIVVSCADHANGGMSIGTGQSGYGSTNISEYLAPLKKARLTGAGVYMHLNEDRTNIREEVAKYYGISDLSDNEVKKIKETKEVMAALGSMMSKRANIGWVCAGHTGEEIPLSVYAPEGYHIGGIVDNTDVSHFIQNALGVSTDETTAEMFVPAREAFEKIGASLSYKEFSSERSMVIAEKNGIVMRLPIDTSIAIADGDVYRLSGVTAVSGGRAYVSAEAVRLLNSVCGGGTY